MLLHQSLEYWSRRCPEASFVTVETGDSITYAEADREAERFASALTSLPVRPGGRVAVLAQNSLRMPLALYGSSKAGCVTVPLNPRLTSSELRHLIENAGALVVVVDGALVPKIEGMRGELTAVRAFVTTADEAPPGWLDWEAWLQSGTPNRARPIIMPQDAVSQIYTSGTTGRPKGAVMSHNGLANNLTRWQLAGVRLDPGETLFLAMPITLAAGLNMAFNAWCTGASVLLGEYDPARTAKILDEGGIAATALAPTMIKRCLESPGATERSYEGLRWLVYGAAPMPIALLRWAMEVLQCDFYQGFGQTEAPTSTMLTPEDHVLAMAGHDHLLGSIGRPYPGTETCLLDEHGHEVEQGSVGEICVRGPFVMTEYWNEPERTAEVSRGGWHHTGDLGYRDADGYLYMASRVTDMIVSGGFNVYPREVEIVLENLPRVAQVAVYGVPSNDWGEEVRAAVVIAPGAVVTADELKAHCREHLAAYKVPKSIKLVNQLPVNANGKIVKTVLREQDVSGDAAIHV